MQFPVCLLAAEVALFKLYEGLNLFISHYLTERASRYSDLA
jgi:hypothetical protein